MVSNYHKMLTHVYIIYTKRVFSIDLKEETDTLCAYIKNSKL